jgi:multiple sugar transport system permease protein
MNKRKLKALFFGTYTKRGLISTIFLYMLLIGISFIFLYPLLQMFVTSLMGLEDLIDATVIWVPHQLAFSNYSKAIEALNFWKALGDSLLVSVLPSCAIVVSSSLIGYGFAKHDFPGKKFWMIMLIVVFLVPTILMSIPTYVTYQELGIVGSLRAFLYPALTGFGLRQVIFILIFYQFFRGVPQELIESAEIDGANSLMILFRIVIPITIPAFLISFLYSFVWYWNETGLATMYLKDNYTTLSMAVVNFKTLYESLYPAGTVGLESANAVFNQGVQFAGTILSIVPLLIVYFIAQKYFVESADRSGLTGQ